MLFTTKPKSIAVVYIAAPRSASFAKRWPLFARFMLALHATRQKAARREIARYHDMIDLERRYDALERRDDNLWRRGTLPFQGP